MTTTPDTRIPDVPVPPGARPGAEGWAFWDDAFRVLHGEDRTIAGTGEREGDTIAEVGTTCCQFPDGSLDLVECPPAVHVNTFTDNGITSAQARQLAAELIEAAEEVDGWVRSQPRG